MAKSKILLSWIVAICGALCGAQLSYNGQTPTEPVPSALIWGYAAWGLYWGIPVVGRWWRRIGPSRRQDTLSGWLLSAALTLVIPVVGGYFYGVLGGGIYQFLKHRSYSRSR